MTTLEFLDQLKRLGVELWLENGDELCFRAKKGVMTAEVKQNLRDRKAEIVQILARGSQVAKQARQAIQPAPSDQRVYPSFAQERLWFVESLDPGSLVYLIPEARRIRGKLDEAALERALRAMIDRHESLRTGFVEEDGLCRIRIEADPPWAMARADLAELGAEARETRARELAGDLIHQPFNLSRPPLFRALLIRLGAEEHALIFCFHHIITDAWSSGVFNAEWTALYQAFAAGEPSPLPPLPLQYADFAYWQRRRLSDEALERQLDFWRGQLAGLEPLETPIDRPRPAKQTYVGAIYEYETDAAVVQKLETLAKQEQASLYMVLLAAFQTLLHRYASQTDIAVGTSIGNRAQPEIEGVIGLFVNLLTMRADLSGDPSFRELLARVRKTALAAFANQDVPFEKVVEACQPERDRSRHPLFQVQFILIDGIAGGGEPSHGLRFEAFDFGEGVVARQDVTFGYTRFGAGLGAGIEYNTDLFDRETMVRLTRSSLTLLAAIADNPDARLSELALLPPEDLTLLAEWNDTARDYPRDRPLHALFEAQAAATPDAPALVLADGAEVSYAALNARANRIAHELAARGAGLETLVGVCLEPGLDMAAALLAILKTGGAYVPLDPDYPQERLSFMIQDTAMGVLVAGGEQVEALPAYDVNFLNMLVLDEEAEALAAHSDRNPDRAIPSEALAYVIYTSGTTGRPKGVMANHRNVVRLVYDRDYVDVQPGDGFVQLSNTAFDALTFEIWTALLHGARLCFIEKRAALEAESFAREIKAKGVDAMFITTSLFTQFVNTEPTMFNGVKQVLFGGEKANPAAAAAVLAAGGPQRLLNAYGPTETVTFAAWRRVTEVPAWADNLPIGGPIANTRLYVVDRRMGLVPIGAFGELAIGGDGVARGYLNRPERTAATFTPDPFGGDGARAYRTGDLVRRLRDGHIEYVGRIDRQIKLRGFRIELGEIEAALKSHPQIRDAAVLLREPGGDKRLAAYLIAAEGEAALSREALRSALLEKVPEYMIPADFVLLEAFPLTPNGKLDRRALPEPDGDELTQEAGYEPPRTPTEQVIADVWAALLQCERVGLRDNFFDLGGHSLLATQVISRVRDLLQARAPIAVLFENPVLGEFAQKIQQELRERRGIPEPPIEPTPAADRAAGLPLSFAQERLWFLSRLDPDSVAYNMPLAFRFEGALDQDLLRRCFDELTRRHEALRTRFVLDSDEERPIQAIDPPSPVEPAVHDFRDDAPPEERERRAIDRLERDALTPFDLERGPLLRISLYRIADKTTIVLMNMHHIVSDGWSLTLFFQELSQLYAAFARDQPSPLAPVTVQYGDFARWQRAWLQGEILDRQLAYWERQLAGLPPLLDLPLDRPRPAVQTFNGKHCSFAIPGETVAAMRALCRDSGTTAFMVYITAFAVFLARYCRQRDICVGTVIANRNRSAIENTFGFFVNSLALRFDVDGEASFGDLLIRARKTILDGYAHQDMPFEQIVERLQPERDLSHSPLFQVGFSVDSFEIDRESRLSLPGVEMSIQPFESHLSKQDLSLHFLDYGGHAYANFEYNIDLFRDETIEAMAQAFPPLLARLLAEADAPLRRIPTLTGEARRHALAQWTHERRDDPPHALHQRFERWAADTPEATAMQRDGAVMSYRELNQRANRVAHRLLAMGLRREDRVGLLLEPSADLVAALIGVLKAGGAYIPLDATYPRERVRHMAAESNMRAMVSRKDLLDFDAGPPALFLEELGQEPETDPARTCAPDQLAYVMFTSGSTGLPKGVAVSHRNLTRLIHDSQLRFQPGDGFAQVCNILFDPFCLEVWCTLAQGAKLVLIDKELLLEPDQLVDCFRREGVNVLCTPAALIRQIGENRPDGLQGMKTVIFGGEKAPAKALRAILAAGDPPENLYNAYGPTEAAVVATYGRIDRLASDAASAPIGAPAANVRVYLLDERLEPAPPGVAAELCIGGDGVARGYLARPDLTAAVFTPDPYAEAAGARLYRSGDLVRSTPAGQIDFIGRVDDQVKLRGFRVELGEIEHALRRQPTVVDAAVRVLGDDPSSQKLVAYAVTEDAALFPPPPDAGDADREARRNRRHQAVHDLREALGAQLPEYMIPTAIVFLDAFPLTANRKIDLQALPAPDEADLHGEAAYEPPQTETEALVAALYAELLKLERVGANDHFFNLGGHSLLATRLIAKLKRRLELNLPIRLVFERPIVRDLARQIDLVIWSAKQKEPAADLDEEDAEEGEI